MKNLFMAAKSGPGKYFIMRQRMSGHTPDILSLSLLFIIYFLLPACSKDKLMTTSGEHQRTSEIAVSSEANAVNAYTGLSAQTAWELQQARAATARYRNIENAIKDGYSNIMVDVENMGHHYMKTAIVDAAFDIRHPEILVYNRNNDGSQELVAVEYAVPLTNPMPEGFTGSADVWKDDSGFPFWLVHAWVWHYNPDGVFNWTNPDVHLH